MTITLTIGVPTGKKANEELRITVFVDAVPITAGTVLLKRITGLPYETASPIAFSGANGVAVFTAGVVAVGTYEVFVAVQTAGDTGFDQGTDLVVDASVSALEKEFLDRIQSTIRASQPVLDFLHDPGPKLIGQHPDIVIDTLNNLRRLAQSPGVIISPGTPDEDGEAEMYVTTNGKVHTLRASVVVGRRAAYEGMRNADIIDKITGLRSAVMVALESNQLLGGFLKKSIIMSETETMEIKPDAVKNATIVIELFTITAEVFRRRGSRR